jgi:hypothetical protein
LLVEFSFGSYLGPSALNGNIKVQAYFLKAKQGYVVRKVEKYKWIYSYYIFISTGMKFRNKKKFRYATPLYTGLIRALPDPYNIY